MDTTAPIPPGYMSDKALLAEWQGIDCDSERTDRNEAPADEIQRCKLDF